MYNKNIKKTAIPIKFKYITYKYPIYLFLIAQFIINQNTTQYNIK